MKPIFAVIFLSTLAGCNTFEGVGRDLAAGGEAIEEAAISAQRPQPVVQPAPQPVFQRAPQQPIYQPVPQQRLNQQQPVQPYTPPQTPNSSYTF